LFARVTHAIGIRFHLRAVVILIACAATITALALISRGPDPQLELQLDRPVIPAGGAVSRLTIRAPIPLPSSGLEAVVAEGGHSARIARAYFDTAASGAATWHVTLQSKALPGRVRVTVSLPPFASVSTWLTISPGPPDVLRLDDPADAGAFRSWFTFLAEAQFFRETSALPKEISDCAGLIRYAYREALRTHDSAWSKASGLPLVPAIPQVRKYEYPFTPWGAALFRTGPATLAEFADAGTLLRYNTHLVSRDVRQARAGDLLFFHQEDAAMPYHSMIYLGASQIENSPGPYVVYHTGPLHESSGEIRRPSVAELQNHPDPAWHLTTENPHYLGVYRWNIL
jgi:uncharacterized protein YfaT (DUF1175 family)